MSHNKSTNQRKKVYFNNVLLCFAGKGHDNRTHVHRNNTVNNIFFFFPLGFVTYFMCVIGS